MPENKFSKDTTEKLDGLFQEYVVAKLSSELGQQLHKSTDTMQKELQENNQVLTATLESNLERLKLSQNFAIVRSEIENLQQEALTDLDELRDAVEEKTETLAYKVEAASKTTEEQAKVQKEIFQDVSSALGTKIEKASQAAERDIKAQNEKLQDVSSSLAAKMEKASQAIEKTAKVHSNKLQDLDVSFAEKANQIQSEIEKSSESVQQEIKATAKAMEDVLKNKITDTQAETTKMQENNENYYKQSHQQIEEVKSLQETMQKKQDVLVENMQKQNEWFKKCLYVLATVSGTSLAGVIALLVLFFCK